MSTDPNDLLAFLALSRAKTYSAAGAELGLNHTTIARRIQRLERNVNSRLLLSSHTGWILTPEGQALLPSALAIEQALRQASGLNYAKSSEPHGFVKVNATELFGVVIAAPALTSVQRRYPAITLDLTFHANHTIAHGQSSDLDIAFLEPRAHGGIEIHQLPEFEFGLYCTSEYIEKSGRPKCLEELTDHTLIRYIDEFPLDPRTSDLLTLTSGRTIGAASIFAQHQMMRLGAGIGVLPTYLVAKEPEFVRLLPTEVSVEARYWMSGSVRTLQRPEVRIVLRAIQQRAEVTLGAIRANEHAAGGGPGETEDDES
jgi:DNA-binding transcriptional LysR family regulator